MHALVNKSGAVSQKLMKDSKEGCSSFLSVALKNVTKSYIGKERDLLFYLANNSRPQMITEGSQCRNSNGAGI